MSISVTEENYLKAIFSIAGKETGKIPNQTIARELEINPATVTEMLRKLAEKGWISYNRTDGAALTPEGEHLALRVIRKHRLWETFLVRNLGFTWDEVHEVAEQLEHIQSEKLLGELDRFLGYPQFDPHGDPIPNALGQMPSHQTILLSECKPGEIRKFVAVANHSPAFLQFLDKIGLKIEDFIEIEEILDFDQSMHVHLKDGRKTIFSAAVCAGIRVS